MANQPKNLGLLHEDKTGLLKHREWRGLKDLCMITIVGS